MPQDCFPLSPATVRWALGAEDSIEIQRRGFLVVPNFSTTIDGATGKTMDTAPADLGGVSDVPSFTRAMKGRVALSRVTKADGMRLTQLFLLALFQQGPRPWPTPSETRREERWRKTKSRESQGGGGPGQEAEDAEGFTVDMPYLREGRRGELQEIPAGGAVR